VRVRVRERESNSKRVEREREGDDLLSGVSSSVVHAFYAICLLCMHLSLSHTQIHLVG